MRIDPKYFNLFIGICAVFTVIIIIFSTIRYSHNQTVDFQNNVKEVPFNLISFQSYSEPDSIRLSSFNDRPIIIHFWSTWSEKSHEIHKFLQEYKHQHPDLSVIAAAVRDADDLILQYIREHPYNFHFVNGTEFYQSMQIPGMPSQILITSNGSYYDSNIGNDITELRVKLDALLDEE